MEKKWTEVDPENTPWVAGDVGGDDQISEAYERRFVLPRRADGLVPVMTLTFYAERNLTVADGVGITRQVEYLVCRDVVDPGGTEVWSDYEYSSIGGRFARDGGDALRFCKEAAAPTLGWWSGEEFYHERPEAPPIEPSPRRHRAA